MTKGKEMKKIKNKEVYAFIASFFTIIGFIIALVLWKENKYVMFYAKQGLVLFFGQILIVIVNPLWFFDWLLWVFWIILWIVSWLNALSGDMKKTFIVGDIADKIKI